MLRITHARTETEQRWTLCGQLTGPWVDELRACWEQRRGVAAGCAHCRGSERRHFHRRERREVACGRCEAGERSSLPRASKRNICWKI